MKNYCGKDCGACTVREMENCPGCSHIADFGGCEIASCCTEKGHESCATCTQRSWCPTVRKAVSMPKYRREKAESEQAAAQELRKEAAVMVKWCVPLFWLLLVLEAVGILETIFENTPPMPYILTGISTLLFLMKAFFLLKLRPMADLYGKAAVFTLLTGMITGLSGFLPTDSMSLGLTFVISLPGAILSCFAIYYIYNAHADAVTMVDCELADKWRSLWKWTILSLAMLVLPLPITILASAITICICGVLELVYLYRMIGAFRRYLDEE
ncbi:MAG: DUF3795 domain-containing protein [Clostridia bacterium]|nr:DUF3795 domain-containing protein [Clostridia bacterium]